MGKSVGASQSYFQDCSVQSSNFRGYTVHGTNNSRLSRNIAYDVKGMCFYLEDGVEENNVFEYNLAAFIHPIYQPANGDFGQGGQTFQSLASLLIPADTSASGFYISNAMNSFIGNAASGGWSGFAFPNLAVPVGQYKDSLDDTSPYLPLHRPLKKFYGNSAHSSGFYWQAHGCAIYVGAWLSYNANGVLVYNSGRNSRDTMFPNGTITYMLFEETKVFLCNCGIGHWGNNVQINSAEMHDSSIGAFLFGSAAIHNALININSKNPNNQLFIYWLYRIGFQFYDTWSQVYFFFFFIKHNIF
jgi:hypothetical protein